jgi:tetratricopeptide (TPR) repeat protein
MKFLFATALLMFSHLVSLHSQDTLRTSDADVHWLESGEMPVFFVEHGAIGIALIQNNTDGSPEVWYSKDSVNLIFFQTLKDPENNDPLFYNSVKAYWPVTMTGDTLKFASEMPFRATQLHYAFLWNGKQFDFAEGWYEDPSHEMVAKAEELLSSGDVSGAIEAYNNVFYPHAYINSNTVCLELLDKAHQMGLSYFKDGKFKDAPSLMDSVFESYFCPDWLDFESMEALKAEMETLYMEIDLEVLANTLADYGLFQYKAGQLDRSIETNKTLNVLFPDLHGPYLQLADALFDKGMKKEASEIYKKYQDVMKKSGKTKQIPSRVKKRI